MEKLIIDTDLGFDCDDAGALAIADILKNKSEIDVLAVTHSINRKKGAEAISIINDYYGNGDIPVGVAERYAINVDKFYDEFYVKFRYTDDFHGWSEEPTFYKILNGLDTSKYDKVRYPHAKNLIADVLRKAADGEVTVVCIGQANNVADILESEGKLYRRKVKRTVIMCGNFTEYDYEYLLGDMYWKGEFNVLLDIPSMQKLFRNIDLPICVLDFNQGFDVLSGESLAAQTNNPVRTAYHIHGKGRTFNLPSWDPMTVMFASGCYDDMFELSDPGTVSVDDNGKSVFMPGKGNHRLIYRKSAQSVFAKTINELLAK